MMTGCETHAKGQIYREKEKVGEREKKKSESGKVEMEESEWRFACNVFLINVTRSAEKSR